MKGTSVKQFSGNRILATTLLVVSFSLGVLALSSLGSAPIPQPAPQRAPAQTQNPSVGGKALLNQFSEAFEDAAAKVNPSVVPIFSEQTRTVDNSFGMPDDQMREFFGEDFFRRFFGAVPGQDLKQTVRAMGSGVIVSPDGYILTNNHVVDGSDKLTVILQDKKKYTATIIGRDPQTDVAVIKIDAKGLPVAALGNSDETKVGQWVIAVGNPFQLYHTTTAGIVSATGRSSMNIADYEDFIQTDASINPGNSGGALADLDGNVIGINTAIYNPNGAGGNVGIGFAIPINLARGIMQELIASGKVTRGYLGLVPQDIDQDLASALKLDGTSGSLVGDVTEGGPADAGGVHRGDVITSFNGKKIESSAQLRNLVAGASPGSTASLSVLRDGHEMDLKVKLGERPENLAERTEPPTHSGEGSNEQLGLMVQNLSPEQERELGYEHDHGVLITAVKSGSAAEESGLRRGDLIKEVNRTPVNNVSEFEKSIDDVGKGHSLALLVRRNDVTFYVALPSAAS